MLIHPSRGPRAKTRRYAISQNETIMIKKRQVTGVTAAQEPDKMVRFWVETGHVLGGNCRRGDEAREP